MPNIDRNRTEGIETDTTGAPGASYESDRYWVVVWSLGCTGFILFIFLVATLQYIRRVYNSPQGRKRLKKRREVKQKAKEEKSIAELSHDPVPAQDFLRDLKKKKKKNTILWEFKALGRQVIDYTHQVAHLAENSRKNATPDVLPYDHCRVALSRLPSELSFTSDYINASYVDSYTKPKAYIATQGPNRRTVPDFWKMVWQENIHCIVMATNLFEHARQQCEKYWHNQHGKYGDIHVWLETADILADFTIRTFRVQKNPGSQERIIKQFQFSCWGDHECPNPGSVLEYRRRIRAFARNKPGPLLVHSGTGAGRTGAFIAIDAALERLTVEKTVDIFNYVRYLRTCRTHMIRNIQQYEFIYDTLAMFLHCGVTVINAKELPYVVQRLAIKDPHTKTNGFEREFKTLQTVVPKLSVGECAGGHRAENRRKSRDIMIQPPERARPYLITHDSNDSTDYINAVYADGYRHGNAYIVTQWPLKSTVNDVWRLIYDYNIPTLVVLNDMGFTRSYPRFWPSKVGDDVHYGPLTVELIEEQSSKDISSRLFRIKKRHPYLRVADQSLSTMETPGTLVSLQAMASSTEDTAKTVRVFQLKCWPNNQKMPSSPAAFIELLTRVENWQVNQCHGRIPTLVMSKNGVSRCGIYCAISITWNKLKTEGEVDIFRAVRTVKSNRTQLVENMVEYIYCYTFVVIMLEILNVTHPHMIPVNDMIDESQCLANPAVSAPDRTASNHSGDDNHVFKSLTTDPSHLALLVHHQNSPKADRRLVRSSTDGACSVDSSDQESYHSTLDIAGSGAAKSTVSRDSLEPVKRGKSNGTATKSSSFLGSLKAPRNGSPGKAIKIFATDNSRKMNGYPSNTISDSTLFPGHWDSFHSERSIASSYDTCPDVIDEEPTSPAPSRPAPPLIVIEKLITAEKNTTEHRDETLSSCSDIGVERRRCGESSTTTPQMSLLSSTADSPSWASTVSLGSGSENSSVHNGVNLKWKDDMLSDSITV